MTFIVPDDYALSGTEVEMNAEGKKMISVAGTGWFTNLDHGIRHQFLTLMTMADNIKFSKHKEVKGKSYQKYDNYDAIEIPFTDAIPSDYDGIMGVPISFIPKYSPEQFEIIDMLSSAGGSAIGKFLPNKTGQGIRDKRPILMGKNTYARIIIKKRN
jgi:hypothetical protein